MSKQILIDYDEYLDMLNQIEELNIFKNLDQNRIDIRHNINNFTIEVDLYNTDIINMLQKLLHTETKISHINIYHEDPNDKIENHIPNLY